MAGGSLELAGHVAYLKWPLQNWGSFESYGRLSGLTLPCDAFYNRDLHVSFKADTCDKVFSYALKS